MSGSYILFIFYIRTDVTFLHCYPFLTIVAGSDYNGGNFQVIIPAGKKKTILTVLTLSNPFCEADEYFKATLILQQMPLPVEVGPDTAFVTITDTTGKCVAMCAHSTPIISKATICILRI